MAIGSGVSGWALSLLFAIAAVWYLVILFRSFRWTAGPGHWRQPVGAFLHVLMCVAMISMFWSWGTAIPAIVQVTVFTAAAAWFAGAALFAGRQLPAASGCHETPAESGASTGPVRRSGQRLGTWYGAAMMGAMVWMSVAMSAMSAPALVLASDGAGASTGSMAGMTMGSGLRHPAGMSAGLPMGSGDAWISVVSVTLCAGFFAAAVWYAVAAFRAAAIPGLRPLRVLVHDGVGALMAAGMAVALLEMA